MSVYTINGRTYTIRPLVLGQFRQLSVLLSDIELPADFTIFDIISKLGDKLSKFLAIILVEEGKDLTSKDLNALEKEIDEHVDLDYGLKMVEDFFDVTPVQSLLSRVINGVNKVFNTTT